MEPWSASQRPARTAAAHTQTSARSKSLAYLIGKGYQPSALGLVSLLGGLTFSIRSCCCSGSGRDVPCRSAELIFRLAHDQVQDQAQRLFEIRPGVVDITDAGVAHLAGLPLLREISMACPASRAQLRRCFQRGCA